MKRSLLLALGALSLLAGEWAGSPAMAQTAAKPWYKQAWDPARVKPCDRPCLVTILDGYLHALETKDRSALPLAEEVAFTENTGTMDLGEGVLWRGALKADSLQDRRR
jgi:hypothetical protein